jgi:hypothetical protein
MLCFHTKVNLRSVLKTESSDKRKQVALNLPGLSLDRKRAECGNVSAASRMAQPCQQFNYTFITSVFLSHVISF